MATGTPISVEEYLSTSYSPDLEYVDGVLVETNVGDPSHGAVQRNICAAVRYRYPQVRAYPEVRSRTRDTRFRLPDVAISISRQTGRYLAESPFVAVEILSEDDRMSRVIEKLKEYAAWGVPNIWLIDPRTRSMFDFRDGVLREITGDTISTESPKLEFTRDEVFWD